MSAPREEPCRVPALSSTIPFAVLGDFAGMVRRAGTAAPGSEESSPPERARGSRRRRLWELLHKFHCPLVGVCFECDDLRGLMRKVMHFPAETTDFVLHTTAVGACETRSRLAEVLQKTLEKRYALAVRKLSRVNATEGLRILWQQAVADGSDIPAMLWSCWTHPAMTGELEQEIFADIHMIQHQVGAGTRADLRTMERLRRRNAELEQRLAECSAELEAARAGRELAARAASTEAAALRTELTAATAQVARLTKGMADLRTRSADLDTRENLAQRLAAVEDRALAERQRADLLERELTRLRAEAIPAESGQAAPEPADESGELPAPRDLAGKCVLCVGGRTGAIDSYRTLVEQSGGRFVHHDGGLEENPHRIDNALAAADLVICQVACISHNAYWRVKAGCKRTGKPCMFVKNAGVTSFERAIDAAGERLEAGLSPA